jgi:Flp pilus assembly pilin Flp
MNGLFMLKNFLLDESGQSVVEYTLLLTLIGATTVFMLTLMGLSLSQTLGVQVTWDGYTQWAYEKFSTK